MNHGIPLYSSEQTVLSYDFVLFSYNLYYYSHHFYMNYTIFIHHINLKKIRKKKHRKRGRSVFRMEVHFRCCNPAQYSGYLMPVPLSAKQTFGIRFATSS